MDGSPRERIRPAPSFAAPVQPGAIIVPSTGTHFGAARHPSALGRVAALCGAFLICAWIAESDSLRSGENIETRGDASNHVIAFVIGCGGAMGSTIVLAIAIAEMFGLFLRRARAGCEPVYGVEARAEDAG